MVIAAIATSAALAGVMMAPVERAGARRALRAPEPAEVEAELAEAGLGEVHRRSRVRVVALGDTGTGSEAQARVARGIQARCDAVGGCDALLLLGDAVYPHGPSSPDDPALAARLDAPYAALRRGPPPQNGEDARPRLPILLVLGNHDLGGAGLDASRVEVYRRAARAHPWLVFPGPLYSAKLGPARFFALHTSAMAYLGVDLDVHTRLMRDAPRDAPWRVGFGHHPHRSNGPHGDAGAYEGVPGDLTVSGGRWRAWFEAHACPTLDLYLAGHDHSRQWLAPDPRGCPHTALAVSGAGAKATPIVSQRNPALFASDALGFLVLDVTPDTLQATFCDANGHPEFTHTRRRH